MCKEFVLNGIEPVKPKLWISMSLVDMTVLREAYMGNSMLKQHTEELLSTLPHLI
jgi:hypothetical protein